jgi:hypothetical protein
MPPAPPLPLDAWADARASAMVFLLLGIAAMVAWRLRARAGAGSDARGGALARWLRALAPGASDAPVRVVQSIRLTPRASLHVLRWDDREWVVGCTDSAVTVIGERARPPDAAAGPAAGDRGALPRRPGAAPAGPRRTGEDA